MDAGKAGSVHGGGRLPWVRFDNSDNYAPFEQIEWQVHVYGEATPKLHDWCGERRIPLHVFPWHDALHPTGLGKDAAYLMRPEHLCPHGRRADRNVSAFDGYLGNFNIRPA